MIKTRRRRSRAARRALDLLGGALFAVGAVNAFIPGLPTTVFWIGAVLCWLKTRPSAVKPILRTPVIGPAIKGFLRWRPFRKGGRRASTPKDAAPI
jgi:uncharacterized protein